MQFVFILSVWTVTFCKDAIKCTLVQKKARNGFMCLGFNVLLGGIDILSLNQRPRVSTCVFPLLLYADTPTLLSSPLHLLLHTTSLPSFVENIQLCHLSCIRSWKTCANLSETKFISKQLSILVNQNLGNL